jgi:hypothetical protein
MTKLQTTPSPKAATLRAVLDTISLRSVFGLDLQGRLDRMRLIEAARDHLGPEADPALVRELLARRTETILALATFPSTDMDAFAAKAEVIGPEVIFPDVPQEEFLLLSLATWGALLSDAKDVGAVVGVASSTPGSSEPAAH